MKIHTTIIQFIEKSNGDSVHLERTIISKHGDNPRFERDEAVKSMQITLSQYIEANALAGTRPL